MKVKRKNLRKIIVRIDKEKSRYLSNLTLIRILLLSKDHQTTNVPFFFQAKDHLLFDSQLSERFKKSI